MPSPFQFKKYGQSGIDVSEIFPDDRQHVDEIAFLRSVVRQVERPRAGALRDASGMIRMGFPSVGSWVTYGLGSENQSLPAFVVIYDARGGPLGGPTNWSAGFMPAAYQGTLFRPSGDPIIDLKPPPQINAEEQRARLDLLAKLNELDLRSIPATPSWPRASRRTSWRTGCRAARRKRSTSTANRDATRKLYGLDERSPSRSAGSA